MSLSCIMFLFSPANRDVHATIHDTLGPFLEPFHRRLKRRQSIKDPRKFPEHRVPSVTRTCVTCASCQCMRGCTCLVLRQHCNESSLFYLQSLFLLTIINQLRPAVGKITGQLWTQTSFTITAFLLINA